MSRSSLRRGARVASRLPAIAGTSIPEPLLDNLQLLLTFEGWTAGTDVQNDYPDNSGVQSLTQVNGVQAASTPLVGSQSVDFYDNSTSTGTYFEHTGGDTFEPTSPFAWTFLIEENSVIASNPVYISAQDASANEGYVFFRDGVNYRLGIYDANNTRYDIEATRNLNFGYSARLVQFGWDGSEAFVRAVGRPEQSASVPSVSVANNGFRIASNSDGGGAFADAKMDMIMFEKVPPGATLQTRKHYEWLDQAALGRSESEIRDFGGSPYDYTSIDFWSWAP